MPLLQGEQEVTVSGQTWYIRLRPGRYYPITQAETQMKCTVEKSLYIIFK